MRNDRAVGQAARGGLRGRAVILLRACHPEPAALVTLLTSLLALAAGRGVGALWVAAAVGAGQLGVGWSNDYLDRDLDRAAGRTDKPLVACEEAATTVGGGALLALLAAVPLSLFVSVGFAVAHLAAVGCALAYNAGLKRTVISVLPYAVAFGLLPVAVALGLSSPHWPRISTVLAAAFAGAGGHFTQSLPDIPADRRQGIRGLPQLVGQRASAVTAAMLLLLANVLASGPRDLVILHAALAAALTGGIVAAALTDRARLAFRLTLASAALAVLAFVASGRNL